MFLKEELNLDQTKQWDDKNLERNMIQICQEKNP